MSEMISGRAVSKAAAGLFAAIFPLFLFSSTAARCADTQIYGSAAMRSMMVSEDFEQARTVGLGLSLNLDHRLADSLTAGFSLGFNLDTGSSQTTFSDEYKPVQGIQLLDVHLSWIPLDGTELRGGAISQSWLQSPLLIGNVAFPAAMAQWKATWNSAYLILAAEQAIPTSDVTNSIPRGNDPLPSADFERVTIGLDLHEFHDLGLQAHLGHYSFNDLPSGVALESRIRGNSVAGAGNQDSQFVYDFNGIEAGARAEGRLASRWRAKLDGTFITNLRAPLEQSRGMLASLETSYTGNPRIVWSPSVQWFRSESDSSPAYYNISNLAHNNRQGAGVGLKVGLPKNQLEIEGSWIKARVIQNNPFQSDFSGVVFSLRKSYEYL